MPVWPACEDLNTNVYVMVLLAVPGEPSVWVQGWVLLQEPPVIAESVAPLGPPDTYPMAYEPNGWPGLLLGSVTAALLDPPGKA